MMEALRHARDVAHFGRAMFPHHSTGERKMRTTRHTGRGAALAMIVAGLLAAMPADAVVEEGPPVPMEMLVGVEAQDLAPPAVVESQAALALDLEVAVPQREVAALAAWGNTEEPTLDAFQYVHRLIVLHRNGPEPGDNGATRWRGDRL